MINASKTTIKVILIVVIIIAFCVFCYRLYFKYSPGKTQTSSFLYEDNLSLNISTVSSDISLNIGDVNEVIIYSQNGEDFKANVKGSSIIISQRDKKRRNGSLEVTLPLSSSLNEVKVRSTGGDIFLANTSSVRLDAETISGDIEVASLSFDKGKLKTVSGDIEIKSVQAKEMECSNVSGDIDMVNLVCDQIEAATVSGDISTTGTVFRILDISSISGDFEIYTDLKPTLEIEKSASGTLTYYGNIGPIRQQTIPGSDNKIVLRTVSGSLDIKEDV